MADKNLITALDELLPDEIIVQVIVLQFEGWVVDSAFYKDTSKWLGFETSEGRYWNKKNGWKKR